MQNSVSRSSPLWLRVLELLPSGLWGALLLHYWRSGDLNLLIHPAYHPLTIVTGLMLLGITVAQGLTFFRVSLFSEVPLANHPRRGLQLLSIAILTTVAIVGFIVPLQVFASSLSSDRSIADFLTLTRTEPEAFRASVQPEDRSIVDWVRTLNVYPEPDAYEGQKVNVTGFVLHPPELSENYILVARFIITCCAADVYPVGLPVSLAGESLTATRAAYPVDGWIAVEGQMTTAVINDQRKLVIQPTKIEAIAEPENPYGF